ncbi:MAG TPA: hypothetical protein VFF66_07515 [Brevundimonas sp.]|nr:hypothetical protein [Brevundimonas sp.]
MLAAAIALILAASPQQASPWGQYQWDNGTGFLSRHYFENRTGFPSGYMLVNSTRAGSFHYLLNGTGPGSAYFWQNGTASGSAYFWQNGLDAGSRHYWYNGSGCLSEFGWRNGAACTGGETLVLQVLCIAQAVDIDPCRAINARLDDHLSRDIHPWSGAPGASTETIARMRERID